MAEPNRRNDVGSKVLISVVAFLIITVIGFSIGVANKADSKVNNLDSRVTTVEVTQKFIREDVKEIKSDVKEIKDAVVK